MVSDDYRQEAERIAGDLMRTARLEDFGMSPELVTIFRDMLITRLLQTWHEGALAAIDKALGFSPRQYQPCCSNEIRRYGVLSNCQMPAQGQTLCCSGCGRALTWRGGAWEVTA